MHQVDRANVYFHDVRCGRIVRREDGYVFTYDPDYLNRPTAVPLSRSLPLRHKAYESPTLHPFFAGLVSEGWLLEKQTSLQLLDPEDLLTILAHNGVDLVGAVTVEDAPRRLL